jgi:hypothetical protein
MQTKYITVQDIKKMKHSEILFLMECLSNPFTGAQSLVAENC